MFIRLSSNGVVVVNTNHIMSMQTLPEPIRNYKTRVTLSTGEELYVEEPLNMVMSQIPDGT